jgi:anhydro-N-acetylmuramic acid kinase
MMMHPDLYIGLMSGTSLDGVDGVLCRIDAQGVWGGVLAHAHRPFERELRQQLLDLQQTGANELHRAMLAGNALARVYARTCAELLDTLPSATAVRAIGVHGQTVRHQPGLHDATGYTVQLNQPALLAELTGIDVIADFRSRDVAAGGQGAPLVPPFHQAVFGSVAASGHRAVVNIGGISNLTVLPDGAGSALRGFDCGPGNALLDHWCLRHLGHEFDADGQWAASGRVLPDLLASLLTEPYFAAAPPKSTGRDLFNPAWLQQHLARLPAAPLAQDVQATLSELTACSIAHDVLRHAPAADTLVVCGGGAFNGDLLRRLQAALPGRQIRPSDDFGLPALQVEAAAFAWLACMHCQRRPASSADVTGATGTRILGASYPA